jgi:hypothetical protein
MMPKRTDISSILTIAGHIVISQAAEFDNSGMLTTGVWPFKKVSFEEVSNV